MIIKPLIAADVRPIRALREAPQVCERRQRSARRRASRHIVTLGADDIGGEAESDRRDTRECARRPSVGREAGRRIRDVPEPAEGSCFEAVEEWRDEWRARRWRRQTGVLLSVSGARQREERRNE